MTGLPKHAFISLRTFVFIFFIILISAFMGLVSKAYATDVTITPENFPDDIFREHIKNTYDIDGNDILSDAEIIAVTFVDVGGMGIKSIEGIKYFTSCEEISLLATPLGNADFSGMTSLKKIELAYSATSAIDVSGCTSLVTLSCFRSYSLTTLETTGATSLDTVWAYDCTKLQYVDFSTNGALRDLRVSSTYIWDINLSQNAALEILYYDSMRAIHHKSPDLSQNKELKQLHLSFNRYLRDIDVSNNPKLEVLAFSYCNIYAIDVSHNLLLKELYANNNYYIQEIDVSNNPELELLWLQDNLISALDVSKNLNLSILSVIENKLTTLDLTNNLSLTSFGCVNNEISSLEIGNKPVLTSFSCANNKITKLDLSGAPLLRDASCADNQIEEIIFSETKKLQQFQCQNNSLINLTIPNTDSVNYAMLFELEGQSCTIPVISNGAGGYVSKHTYNLINPAFNFSSVSYDAVKGTIYTTELGTTEYSGMLDIPESTVDYPYYLTGSVTFVEVPADNQPPVITSPTPSSTPTYTMPKVGDISLLPLVALCLFPTLVIAVSLRKCR